MIFDIRTFLAFALFLLNAESGQKPALAQTAGPNEVPVALKPRFVTIPLDETAKDVKALRAKVPTSSKFEGFSRRSFSPSADAGDKRFLAAIDLGKVNFDALRTSGRLREGFDAAFTANVQTTTYGDSEDAPTWFKTTYDSLNATLQCHWAYDANKSALLAAQAAKMTEQQLELAARRKRLGLPDENLLSPDQLTQPPPKDPEHNHYEKEKQFKVAGRPCLLTVECETEDDKLCEDAFLDSLVANVVTLRTGD